MAIRVLSLTEVAEKRLVPLSRSKLYEIAGEEGSPFRKVAGKWMTTEEDLVRWVRGGENASSRSSRGTTRAKRLERLAAGQKAKPMSRVAEILAEIERLRQEGSA